MKDTYWWIEQSDGYLAHHGREIHGDEIWEGGLPKLFRTRKEILPYIYSWEKPVKVKLIKVDD
jgi:hypothetical protein